MLTMELFQAISLLSSRQRPRAAHAAEAIIGTISAHTKRGQLITRRVCVQSTRLESIRWSELSCEWCFEGVTITRS